MVSYTQNFNWKGSTYSFKSLLHSVLVCTVVMLVLTRRTTENSVDMFSSCPNKLTIDVLICYTGIRNTLQYYAVFFHLFSVMIHGR